MNVEEMSSIIKKLEQKEDLTGDECEEIMTSIMSGETDKEMIKLFLVAMKNKGESAREIASLASIMKKFSERINPKVKGILTDTCGTGGDKLNTFNISTVSMFVVAGAGIPIAKHGNRAVSSNSGSADVLEELGININLTPKQVESCIEKIGIGFMFAPTFHKAMKHVMPARKELATRTVFNILGPLTNPANAQAQVIGVFDSKLTEVFAEVLKMLKIKSAMIVHGLDGMDEISTIGKTKISELKDNEIKTYYVEPEELGIKKSNESGIKGGDAGYNVGLIKKILNPNEEDSPERDIVLINSAAGIMVGGKADSLSEGIKMARESVKSGKAREKLEVLIKFSNSL